jgi:hypothetical protein
LGASRRAKPGSGGQWASVAVQDAGRSGEESAPERRNRFRLELLWEKPGRTEKGGPTVSLLYIILIVVIVLLLLGFFTRGRW